MEFFFLQIKTKSVKNNIEVEDNDQDNEKIKRLLILSTILFTAAFFLPNSANIIKLPFFILSGICVGIFYGNNDHRIWSFPYKNKYYERVQQLNDFTKAHILWVHIIGGITGGIAMYFLSSHICFGDPRDIFYKAGWIDLILFLITLLGYSGYIPRTLWFFANKGGLGTDRPS
ncbi:hypothetical protein HYZ05_00010 [Candidatus Daviesbacteria bacterium]|nr:hypothetical protein [Candidatus Daviesbacteria bacterium]